MADDDTRTTTPEEPLAWEARNARRAGYAAIAAAVLSLTGNVLRAVVESGFDRSAAQVQTFVDTLGRAAAGRPPVPGAASAFAEYIGTHTAGFLVAAALLGAGGLLIFLPLAYLFRAVRARVPLSPIGLIITAVGAAGVGIGQLLLLVATVRATADFADGTDRSNAAANDALGDSTAAAAQLVRDLGG